MSITLKPGKWVQRDGGIATVVAVDESRAEGYQAIGWLANGKAYAWPVDGWAVRFPTPEDLIREYREPREWWIVLGGNGLSPLICKSPKEARECLADTEENIIHVREVLE